MTITPGLAAELALLTQALDLPGTDVAETLTRLAADAQSAVDSYLGLTVTVITHATSLDFTVLNDETQPEHIRTSLLVPLSPATTEQKTVGDGIPRPASIAVILYAATVGAFIDLAADLSWITGRSPADFRLDEHLTLPPSYTDPSHLRATSTINQALGVLLGRGFTPEQALRELSARAATAGIELVGAATLILAAVGRPHSERP